MNRNHKLITTETTAKLGRKGHSKLGEITMQRILEKTDVRTLLSTLWLFVLFNIFFADFQWFVTTGAIEEILSGTVRGNQVTPNLLLIASLVHELPVLMLLLSRVLTRNINRPFNIVAGVLNFFFAVSDGWTTPDQIFFKVVMAIGLLLIVWTAWRWPHPSSSLAKLESQRAKIVARASVGVALIGLLAAAPASSQKGGFELGVGACLMSLGDKLGGDTGLSLDVQGFPDFGWRFGADWAILGRGKETGRK